jgi:hypothetical protein
VLWKFITKHFEAGDGINPQPVTRAVDQVAQVSSSQGSARKRGKGAYDKKARSNCRNCGEEGHRHAAEA